MSNNMTSLSSPVMLIDQKWNDDTLPLVSIQCITYNHVHFIKEAIDSLLFQKTTFPVEILIGEDCSTDGTKEVVFQYSKRYPSIIRVISSDSNVGMMENGKRTLTSANGKYIAICEGDDFWTDPLKLQKQVDFMEANADYSFVTGNSKFVTNGIEKTTKLHGDLVTADLVHDNNLGYQTASLMFRAEYISGIIKALSSYPWPFGDMVIYFYCLNYGKGKVLADVLSFYRIHGGGMWSSQNKVTGMHNTLFFYAIALKSGINKHYGLKEFEQSLHSILGGCAETKKPKVTLLQKVSVKGKKVLSSFFVK